MAEYRAIALDFDGTLADSPRVHRLAREQAYDALAQNDERFLKSAERDAVLAIAHRLGTTSIGIEAEILRRLGIVEPDANPNSNATITEVAGIKGELYRAIAANGLPSNPGAIDFVRDAADEFGVRGVAIVTTASNAEVDPFVDLHGIGSCVGYVVSRDFRGGIAPEQLKPHPYQYQQTARLLGMTGILAYEIAAVEDSPGGIVAAKFAGLGAVGLATTHEPGELLAADAVVHDFTELRGVVLPATSHVR